MLSAAPMPVVLGLTHPAEAAVSSKLLVTSINLLHLCSTMTKELLPVLFACYELGAVRVELGTRLSAALSDNTQRGAQYQLSWRTA